MSTMYHEGQRSLQDRFDTRRLADRLEEVKVHSTFTQSDREFIESRDLFFLATVGPDGWPSCSYKGGDPGFVRVVDQAALAFPCYDGNGMFLSMGNALTTAKVGMLFLDFEVPRRLRVEGNASLHFDDPLLTHWPEAQFVVRVAVARIYPNCPRYVHHYRLLERSRFVPRSGHGTPIPDWKRAEWARDVLAEKDPARRGTIND
jgi:predicted pyridoxine 5'-phosphate oxidase superfamily flavin-nucleotide-binding protein